MLGPSVILKLGGTGPPIQTGSCSWRRFGVWGNIAGEESSPWMLRAGRAHGDGQIRAPTPKQVAKQG